MATFIKAGFWEKLCIPCKGYKGWLNLDQFVESKVPAPAYKVYTAILNQTEETAPDPTVLENSIGTIVWGYVSAGVYSATLNGAFTLNKVFIITSKGENNNAGSTIITNLDINGFLVQTLAGNGRFTNFPIEIRVYN